MLDSKILKIICYVIAPLALVGIELFHPSGYSKAVYENLLPHSKWWLQLHTVQPLFFALVGVGGILLTWKLKGFFSLISKIFLFLFIIYYNIYDAVAGIGTGVLIEIVNELPEPSQTLGTQIVQDYFFHPIYGGSHTWLSEFASMTWLVGIWSAVIALIMAKRSFIPLTFVALSGAFIWYNHGFPTGPIGFSCFFIGATWIGFSKA